MASKGTAVITDSAAGLTRVGTIGKTAPLFKSAAIPIAKPSRAAAEAETTPRRSRVSKKGGGPGAVQGTPRKTKRQTNLETMRKMKVEDERKLQHEMSAALDKEKKEASASVWSGAYAAAEELDAAQSAAMPNEEEVCERVTDKFALPPSPIKSEQPARGTSDATEAGLSAAAVPEAAAEEPSGPTTHPHVDSETTLPTLATKGHDTGEKVGTGPPSPPVAAESGSAHRQPQRAPEKNRDTAASHVQRFWKRKQPADGKRNVHKEDAKAAVEAGARREEAGGGTHAANANMATANAAESHADTAESKNVDASESSPWNPEEEAASATPVTADAADPAARSPSPALEGARRMAQAVATLPNAGPSQAAMRHERDMAEAAAAQSEAARSDGSNPLIPAPLRLSPASEAKAQPDAAGSTIPWFLRCVDKALGLSPSGGGGGTWEQPQQQRQQQRSAPSVPTGPHTGPAGPLPVGLVTDMQLLMGTVKGMAEMQEMLLDRLDLLNTRLNTLDEDVGAMARGTALPPNHGGGSKERLLRATGLHSKRPASYRPPGGAWSALGAPDRADMDRLQRENRETQHLKSSWELRC